ncbi:MAG: alpha/beta hydrolase [Chitinophagaceae bacterium]|nr:MAG: alpha/beta hydrolase [Chitinophagaceae bacterium]
MSTIESKTIVFITGAFVSHACWDNWAAYFQQHGYDTLAPAWPGKNADPATLRNRHPDPVLAAVTFEDIVGYYTSIISQLPEKPILIGHSLGGLLVQVLLNKGFGAAGVAIHPLPPPGIIVYEWRFLKSNIRAADYLTSISKTYMMSFKKWQEVFTNGMTLEQQKDGYYDFAIPESKRVIRGAWSANAKIDFNREHHPLLLIAGSGDHYVPVSLVRRTHKKYKTAYSIVDFFIKNRNHFVLGAPTWKEDAEEIARWLNGQ